jgi:hypothetical protein
MVCLVQHQSSPAGTSLSIGGNHRGSRERDAVNGMSRDDEKELLLAHDGVAAGASHP